jgi:hypothetical protein
MDWWMDLTPNPEPPDLRYKFPDISFSAEYNTWHLRQVSIDDQNRIEYALECRVKNLPSWNPPQVGSWYENTTTGVKGWVKSIAIGGYHSGTKEASMRLIGR